MFIDFFYRLRDRGLSLGVTEFITLLDARVFAEHFEDIHSRSDG